MLIENCVRDMHVRDAVEADAKELAAQTGAPRDVMRNLVHDRSVRVATAEECVEGFVSFDVHNGTVHVTQLQGNRDACEQLLNEPIRFAKNEGMAVELLVDVSDETLRETVESASFQRNGNGPTFEGTRTVKYRFES